MMDTSILKPGEHMDSLDYRGMMLIQHNDSFCFGTDSVLLANFARVNAKDCCIDLGAGSGVLSVLIHARTHCNILAVEVDSEQCDRLKRTISVNGIQRFVQVRNIDYIDQCSEIGMGKFDAAVCNPPYFRSDCGTISNKAGATHEVLADIDRISSAASSLLKFGGKLFICFPAGRLCEAVCSLCANALEPKRMRLVSSTPNKKPYLCLIEAKKGGKHGVIVEKELVIHNEAGEYTEELKRIYHLGEYKEWD